MADQIAEVLDGPYDNPLLSPVCARCIHWNGPYPFEQRWTCAAFPERIPVEIWKGENHHTEPYPGDHGIRFEPILQEVTAGG